MRHQTNVINRLLILNYVGTMCMVICFVLSSSHRVIEKRRTPFQINNGKGTDFRRLRRDSLSRKQLFVSWMIEAEQNLISFETIQGRFVYQWNFLRLEAKGKKLIAMIITNLWESSDFWIDFAIGKLSIIDFSLQIEKLRAKEIELSRVFLVHPRADSNSMIL